MGGGLQMIPVYEWYFYPEFAPSGALLKYQTPQIKFHDITMLD